MISFSFCCCSQFVVINIYDDGAGREGDSDDNEIFRFQISGQVPYPNIHAREIGARLKGGYRMEKPEFADNL